MKELLKTCPSTESSNQILVLPLNNSKSRPFFFHEYNGHIVRFLFDTGAHTPVWCRGEDLLKKAFPASEKTNLKSIISGFGKGYVSGSVYIIPRFELSNNGCLFCIKNLYIAIINNKTIGCDFVLSSTMFSKSNCTVANIGDKRLIIESSKSEYYCTPVLDKTVFEGITVWSQYEL